MRVRSSLLNFARASSLPAAWCATASAAIVGIAATLSVLPGCDRGGAPSSPAEGGPPASSASPAPAASASATAAASAMPSGSAAVGAAGHPARSAATKLPAENAIDRLGSAYDAARGPEPKPTDPGLMPGCATTLARNGLLPEHQRREGESLGTWRPQHDAWQARRDALRAALALSITVAPVKSAQAPVMLPDVGKPTTVKDLPAQPELATAFQSELAKLGGLGDVTCTVMDIAWAPGMPDATIVAAAKALERPAPPAGKYRILCESGDEPFVVEVAPAQAWLTFAATPDGKGVAPSAYHLEADRAWDAPLRGKQRTLAIGQKLSVSGVRRVRRGNLSRNDPLFAVSGTERARALSDQPRAARSVGMSPWRPDWDGTRVWTLSFEPACAHEGLACTFDDGLPAAKIAAEGGECRAAIVEHKADWLTSITAGKAAGAAGMLALLEAATEKDAELRAAYLALAEARTKANDAAGAAAAYASADRIQPNDANTLRSLGAAYVESNQKPAALSALHAAAALETANAAHQKEVAALLDVAGDKAGAKEAYGRACSAGDEDACKAAK